MADGGSHTIPDGRFISRYVKTSQISIINILNIFSWAEDFNGHFTKEYVQMAKCTYKDSYHLSSLRKHQSSLKEIPLTTSWNI